MSQFLWVEDFEENNSVKPYTDFIFGELLQDLKSTERPTNKEEMRLLLEERGVFLELTFTEGLQFIHDPNKLSQVDYVILDVRLAIEEFASENNERLSDILEYYQDETDPKMALKICAGYQLYIELVVNLGFPKEHILLCSNHADHLESLKAAFKQAKMKFPQIPTKGEKDKSYVRQWVKERKENPYFVLRRGIIEGCQFLLSQLDSRPALEIIQFHQFLNSKTSADDIVKDMRDYLTILQRFLPLRQPNEQQKHDDYKLFVRTLVHDWDAAHPKNLPKCQPHSPEEKIHRINSTFGRILKNTRNWITHSIFLDDLSEQEVAFLFMVAMRAMFKLDSQTEKYENQLFTLFCAEKTDCDVMISEIKDNKVRLHLAETYSDLKNIVDRDNVKDAFHFTEMLNNLHNAKVPHHYKKGLFQIFWHGLSPVRLHREKGKDGKLGDASFVLPGKKMVCTNYFFQFYDYGSKEKGFLFDLACHIYQRSFN